MTYTFLDHDGVLAFAHRGGAEEGAENTMPAFQHAVDVGFRYLETDAYTTRDGVVLAFHDPSLDRVTDRKGLIEELDYAEVREARVGGTEPIPLLAEVLDAWPEVRVNIDPKHDGAVAPLIELIKKMNVTERVCIGSFSGDRVDQVRTALGPKLCTSMSPLEIARLRVASFAGALAYPSSSVKAGCLQVPVKFRNVPVLNESLVKTAVKYGLQVHAWTINDEAQMQDLLAMGVHGIMTDRPSTLRKVLEKAGKWAP
jgi:glycerophosphoryl diester phosphodiesterase